jgi:hypothetical protein
MVHPSGISVAMLLQYTSRQRRVPAVQTLNPISSGIAVKGSPVDVMVSHRDENEEGKE